jgi:16S rRNA (uracil1498-N3)-methyltransferase
VTLALFLLDSLPASDLATLTGEEGRHAKVKRVQVGEQILVGDGRGSVLTATVTSIVGDTFHLAVTERAHVPPNEPRLVVVQALPKGERAELAVELLTELGVDEIVPWAAARAVPRWEPGRAAKALSRWARVAREATKQSRRAWLPSVSELATTTGVAARLRSASTAIVLHEDATDGIASANLARSGELILVVGPEGGIAPDELAVFMEAGASCVRLGPAVLRTSTAGGAALAALNLRLDRWR